MANNLFANIPAAVVANTTISFSDAGLTSDNIFIVYEVGSPLKSWVPARDINAITGFTSGKGYYVVPKASLDLSAYLIPPIPAGASLPTANRAAEWDHTTGVTTDGSGVIGWAEKSGNGKNWAWNQQRPSSVDSNGIHFTSDGLADMILAAPLDLTAFTIYARINPSGTGWEIMGGTEDGSFLVYSDVSLTETAPRSAATHGNRQITQLLTNGEAVFCYAYDGVGTFPESVPKLYVNGVLTCTFDNGDGAGGGNLGSGFSLKRLGGEGQNLGFNFKGTMKHILIYNVQHTPEQIAQFSALL